MAAANGALAPNNRSLISGRTRLNPWTERCLEFIAARSQLGSRWMNSPPFPTGTNTDRYPGVCATTSPIVFDFRGFVQRAASAEPRRYPSASTEGH